MITTIAAIAFVVRRSKRERALWFPVVAVMLACSLVVALR
jgi:hypothetical protein